ARYVRHASIQFGISRASTSPLRSPSPCSAPASCRPRSCISRYVSDAGRVGEATTNSASGHFTVQPSSSTRSNVRVPHTPRAREANVARYIDTMLGAFTFHPARIHAGGPFSNRAGASHDAMARFVPLARIRRLGWERRIAQLHRTYRRGVKELDAMSSSGD